MKRILIVDDKEENLYLLRVLLEGHGYEVEQAANGSEALDKARAGKQDMIISDILMPVMDGFTLCKALKADDRLKHIPLVFYTATYTDPKDEKLALDMGVNAFIVKPAEPDEFMRRIEEIFAAHKDGKLSAPQKQTAEDEVVLKEYNEVLIRKLEHKMFSLEKANKALETEMAARKQAEEALRGNNALFAKISSQVPGMLYRFMRKPDGTYSVPFSNDGVKELFGCTPEDVRNNFDPIFQAIFPEDRDKILQTIEESAKSLLPWTCEYRVQLPDKPVKWILGNSIPEKMADGAIVWSGYNTDITQRKEIEFQQEAAVEALKESERQYRNLFDSFMEGIFQTTLKGKLIKVNSAFAKMFGYESPEEIIGVVIDIAGQLYALPEERKNIVNTLKENGYLKDYECKMRRKDGTLFWTLINARLTESRDGRRYFEGSIIDINDRKKAEFQKNVALEALQESERRLREVQEMVHLGSWYWDVKTGEVKWSAEVYKIFRLDPKEFTPHIDSILALSPWPEDHQRDKELINRAIEKHGSGFYEQKFLRPDKTIGHYYSTFQGNYNENGDLNSIIGTVMDITERKQAEEKINQLNVELEQKVAERTRELQDSQLALLNLVDDLNQSVKSTALASRKLEETNNELKAFSYSVSHDLRAPLRSIDGFSLALMEDYQERLDDTGRNYLHKIRAATQHMGLLIEDMLKLSRISHAEFRHESIDLSKMVRSIAKTLQQSNPDEDMKMTIQEGMVIRGDLNAMQIALTNLLENAWKFTGKQKHPSIEFGMTLTEGKKVFFIRDNGVGFDMAYANKLFGAFQRLHGTDEFPGTGIGLATVKRIITRHGGQIWAEGEVGKGAVFYFTLPE